MFEGRAITLYYAGAAVVAVVVVEHLHRDLKVGGQIMLGRFLFLFLLIYTQELDCLKIQGFLTFFFPIFNFLYVFFKIQYLRVTTNRSMDTKKYFV